eukprot:4449813-Pyramimonas_sp.AAC.2
MLVPLVWSHFLRQVFHDIRARPEDKQSAIHPIESWSASDSSAAQDAAHALQVEHSLIHLQTQAPICSKS